jgi:hypothetical protein
MTQATSAYITPKVPTSDSGTTTLGMTVAQKWRRNRKITTTTSPIVTSNVSSTSWTDARMFSERSETRSNSDQVNPP